MIPAIVYWIAAAVVSSVISYVLRPKLKRTSTPSSSPPPQGEFQVPLATAGSTIPVAFGTVYIQQPNVVWYGDLAVRGKVITETVSASGSSGKK